MKITNNYRSLGIQEYYQDPETQKNYFNPHEDFIKNCLMNSYYNYFTENNTVLDLCSGNGLVSSVLKSCGVYCIEGADKYMHERYTEETGFKCYPYTFEDIADFNCTFENNYDVIICSYAFDIVPDSYREKLLYALSTYAENLILIRPNSHCIKSEIWDLVHFHKESKSRASVYKKKAL